MLLLSTSLRPSKICSRTRTVLRTSKWVATNLMPRRRAWMCSQPSHKHSLQVMLVEAQSSSTLPRSIRSRLWNILAPVLNKASPIYTITRRISQRMLRLSLSNKPIHMVSVPQTPITTFLAVSRTNRPQLFTASSNKRELVLCKKIIRRWWATRTRRLW